MKPEEDPFEEYRTLGDEKPKPIKWERHYPDETIHLRRRNQQPTTMSVEDYYNKGGYAYGKRKKK